MAPVENRSTDGIPEGMRREDVVLLLLVLDYCSTGHDGDIPCIKIQCTHIGIGNSNG
jgi:hypothetical protein